MGLLSVRVVILSLCLCYVFSQDIAKPTTSCKMMKRKGGTPLRMCQVKLPGMQVMHVTNMITKTGEKVRRISMFLRSTSGSKVSKRKAQNARARAKITQVIRNHGKRIRQLLRNARRSRLDQEKRITDLRKRMEVIRMRGRKTRMELLKRIQLVERKQQSGTSRLDNRIGQVEKQQKSADQTLKNQLRAYKSGFDGVQRRVSQIETTMRANKGCPNRKFLGYTYNVRSQPRIDHNTAQIASVTFTKKRSDTMLRMSYAGNVGMHRTGTAKWYFKIDGHECTRPAPIFFSYQRNSGGSWLLIPTVLKGLCQGTGRGNIGRGRHTITVHVGQLDRGHRLADILSGWRTTSTLEVQEICKPF